MRRPASVNKFQQLAAATGGLYAPLGAQGQGLETIYQQALAPLTKHDLASRRQVAGLALGRGITLLLMLFILTGGAIVATDSIAGEKERGTLETLLTTAASRVRA